MKKRSPKRLVIVSNRLPISIEWDNGKPRARHSSGGLVTALGPIMRQRGGLWIGWPGSVDKVDLGRLIPASEKPNYGLRPVWLTSDERDKFYLGFSNEVIWPLFHALQTVCNFDPEFWTMYRRVNRKYAQVAKRHAGKDDYIWVHDYHLILVAQELRRTGVTGPIGFFLHIPFPAPDIFVKMPWRREILEALLEYDILGFQTVQHRRNFIQCLRNVIGDVGLEGKGHVLRLKVAGRRISVGYFPISIDYDQFASEAGAEAVSEMARNVRQQLPDRQLVLGIDRLDYTKGIPYKLDAFRNALLRYPELRERISLVQVLVPSRADIAPYHDLKIEIDRLVGAINGEFTKTGWIPIHYIFRHLDRVELLALYRAAGIALVTPLEDGMNLVAKEYCVSSVEEDSVLILSEFAGAAVQLQRHALIVNPYDRDGVADAIHRAYHMPQDERRQRMHRLRRSIQDQNIYEWVDDFLLASAASAPRLPATSKPERKAARR